MSENEICYMNAVDLVAMIKNRTVSAVDVMQAFLARIEAVNPKVNAICALRPASELLKAAQHADEAMAGGKSVGPLHGLPLAVKDLALTKGIKTTFGSRIYKDFVPDQDEIFVERLKDAGALIIGKTNVPEFGAGSHTFNEVYGATRNPYDLAMSAGGSSGGAAAALAAGMLPMADGSDLGGSLRNPAGFCNVVGFRPSPGRVPMWPSAFAWQTLSVEGPMARNVKDTALLLSVMAGPDARAPGALDEPGTVFSNLLEREFKNVRIAWTPDLGKFPVQQEVAARCEKSLSIFETLGCKVDQAEPRVGDAFAVFQVLRAFSFLFLSADYTNHRALMKETVAWNIQKGIDLSSADIVRAEMERTHFYHRVRTFLEQYEFLVLPSTQVAPFPVEQEWIREIEGVDMTTYIDWMAMNCVVTLTGLPAISVPCGFTAQGLPVGLQIVGRHHRDFDVLQLAYAFEQATRFSAIRPMLADQQ
ncbi:MAG: amidase [Deltaproteobacteria bacterium]|nr:amidase [Deltaproteobacteria bacterium]